MSGPIARRIAASAAALLLAASGITVLAAPAHAAREGCFISVERYEQAGSHIYAGRRWLCDDGSEFPLPVSIQRYLSPGVWQTVASGEGDTVYYCNGWAYNVYKTTGRGEFAILCG